MGVAVSLSLIVSVTPSFSLGGLFTLFPCSSTGSLPQVADLQRLLRREYFPRFPGGAVLLEQTAPAWVTHGVTSSARKPPPAWAPLSMHSQVLQGFCSSTGSPWAHSLHQASICSSTGFSTGCRWIPASSSTSMGCLGTPCLTMVFTIGCRWISAVAPGAPPPPPSSLTLMSAEFSLLSPAAKMPLHNLFFFLTMLSQRHYQCCWWAWP